MPVAVSVRLDSREVEMALRKLGSSGAAVAMSQALNRTVTGVRTDATRAIAEKAKVKKQATVRNRFTIEKAARLKLAAALVIPPTSLPLSAVRGVRATARRVTWRGRHQKRMFRIKGAVGKLRNDIFVRVPGKRSPLRAYAFTLLQEYEHHRIADDLERKATVRLQKEWRRALENQLRRRGLA